MINSSFYVVNFSLLIRSNFTFYMANSTFYMIKSTFYIVNFEPFQNALRLITNKMAAYTPSRERNEYRLFLFFDNLKILLSTVSSFEEAETITCPLRMLIRQLIDCGLRQRPFSYSPQTLGTTKILLMRHQS